jgi:hypothetical protein
LFNIGAVGEGSVVRVKAENVVSDVEPAEPEAADLSQDSALIRNARWQNPVKRTDPVCGNEQQSVVERVNVPDFA